MSDMPVAPGRSTWDLVEAMVAEEEREIDGLTREQLVARYVEAGIDPTDVEAHVDEIIRDREQRRQKAGGAPGASVQDLTREQLDGELVAAGIEPESLRRIARQVFAQFGIEDSAAASSEPGDGEPD
jgi:hypothetical protein